jgi:hypothetical protein
MLPRGLLRVATRRLGFWSNLKEKVKGEAQKDERFSKVMEEFREKSKVRRGCAEDSLRRTRRR